MKVRNILIGLLVVLMAFVFISCEDEPEVQPQPQPAPVDDNSIAKITVTKGIDVSVYKNEKIQLQWDLTKALGEDTDGIVDGSVLELKFRSSRDIQMVDLRTNKKGVVDKETGVDAGLDVRWIYEDGSLDALDTLEKGEDGWYTLKYTFTKVAAKNPGNLDYDKYYYTNLGMNFAGFLMKDDVLEIKSVKLDGKSLPLSADILNYADSSIEILTAEEDWSIAKTYAVVYALNGSWRSDAGVPVEAVAAGGKATGVQNVSDNYIVSYSDGDEAFDLNTVIEKDMLLSYTLKGVDVDITFHKNYLGAEDEELVTTTEFGKAITPPATDDWKRDGWKITGWATEAVGTEENKFDVKAAVESTDAIELYAQWSNVATLTLNLNYPGAEPKEIDVVMGAAPSAAQIGRPGYFFDKWTLGSTDLEGTEDDYDYSSVVTGDKTIYAQWVAPTKAYKFTATVSHGRFQWRLRETIDTALSAIQPGDVISFQVKFISEQAPSVFRLRTRSGECNITSTDDDEDGWVSIPVDADANGWYTITVVAPVRGTDAVSKAKYSGKGGLFLAFEADDDWAVGDVCIIKSFAYNGHELELVTGDWNPSGPGRDFGAYDAVCPDSEEVDPITLDPITP